MKRACLRCFVQISLISLLLGSNCQVQIAGTFPADLGAGSGDGGAPGDVLPADVQGVDVGAADLGEADVRTHDSGAGDMANGQDVQAVDGGAYHPQGWMAPSAHGMAAKLQEADCRSCHGSDLNGYRGRLSCDPCHPVGWRTDCTFCHGGEDSQMGAPPVDLRGASAVSEPGVGAHTAHLTALDHKVYDCETCHVVHTDVLSAGHMFDSTPGAAEVDLGGGLSPTGIYNDPGCSNLYCHGNGRTTGSSPGFTTTIDSCSACHPSSTSSSDDWEGMSGRHKHHLEDGLACSVCHGEVVNSSSAIVGPALHVNGAVNVLPYEGSYSSGSCTTICHDDESWGN